MSETIWVSDSDICECGALLDYFGICPRCGWNGVGDEDNEYPLFEEDEDEDPTIGTPEEAYAVALSLSDEDMCN